MDVRLRHGVVFTRSSIVRALIDLAEAKDAMAKSKDARAGGDDPCHSFSAVS